MTQSKLLSARRPRTLLAMLVALITGVAFATPASAGVYTMVTEYNGDISQVRGWQIEWRVPEVTNASDWNVSGVVGQWLDNLESGVYLWQGQWHIYFYGDDNGLDNHDSSCSPNWQNDQGQHIGGWCSQVSPGQVVSFKYERCNTSNVPDVNGNQWCLWVKEIPTYFEPWKFLARDDMRNPQEMYAHDVETFTDHGMTEPLIPCGFGQAVEMQRQTIKTPAGTWQPLRGESTWTFKDEPGNNYKFQDKSMDSWYATWETCSD